MDQNYFRLRLLRFSLASLEMLALMGIVLSSIEALASERIIKTGAPAAKKISVSKVECKMAGLGSLPEPFNRNYYSGTDMIDVRGKREANCGLRLEIFGKENEERAVTRPTLALSDGRSVCRADIVASTVKAQTVMVSHTESACFLGTVRRFARRVIVQSAEADGLVRLARDVGAVVKRGDDLTLFCDERVGTMIENCEEQVGTDKFPKTEAFSTDFPDADQRRWKAVEAMNSQN